LKYAPNDEQARHRWIAAQILPYEGEVRGWLRRHARSLRTADVDDLVQEAYARLWLTDFSAIANGRSYFYTIVRNLLLEHLRRARIVPMERLGEIEALRIPSEEPGPERHVTARQELERLERIVQALPAQCQLAFRLQKFGGLSQREIATEMNISEKTVEKHLATALVRVLQLLTEEQPDSTVQREGAPKNAARHQQD
jgi:RNA polymerase sigma factor (sigma-70 family)